VGDPPGCEDGEDKPQGHERFFAFGAALPA
jgi:hypothetical protein